MEHKGIQQQRSIVNTNAGTSDNGRNISVLLERQEDVESVEMKGPTSEVWTRLNSERQKNTGVEICNHSGTEYVELNGSHFCGHCVLLHCFVCKSEEIRMEVEGVGVCDECYENIFAKEPERKERMGKLNFITRHLPSIPRFPVEVNISADAQRVVKDLSNNMKQAGVDLKKTVGNASGVFKDTVGLATDKMERVASDSMRDLRNEVSKIEQVTHETTESFGSHMEDFKAMLTNIIEPYAKGAGYVEGVIAILLTMKNVADAKTMAQKVSIVSQSIFAFGIGSMVITTYDIAKWCCDTISWITNVNNRIEPQSDTERNILEKAWQIFTGFFWTRMEADVKPTRTFRPFNPPVKELATTMGSVKTIGQAFEYIGKVLWYAFGWVYMKVFGEPLLIGLNANLRERAKNWARDVEMKTEGIEDIVLMEDLGRCGEIKQLMKEGLAIEVLLLEAGYNAVNYPPFFQLLHRVKGFYDKVELVFQSSRARKPPVFVHFKGPPGTAKSGLSQMLAIDLFRLVGVKVPLNNLIYPRMIEQEYWDMYANQRVCIIDDIFQEDNKEKQAQLAMEIIHMCNTMPYPLHMAQATEKGKVFFTSEVIFTTSNAKQTPALSLDPEEGVNAYNRRRDFVFEVALRPGYKVEGNLLYFEGTLIKDYSRDAYDIKLCDSLKENIYLKQNLGYKEVLALVYTRYLMKNQGITNIGTWLDDHPVTDLVSVEDIKLIASEVMAVAQTLTDKEEEEEDPLEMKKKDQFQWGHQQRADLHQFAIVKDGKIMDGAVQELESRYNGHLNWVWYLEKNMNSVFILRTCFAKNDDDKFKTLHKGQIFKMQLIRGQPTICQEGSLWLLPHAIQVDEDDFEVVMRKNVALAAKNLNATEACLRLLQWEQLATTKYRDQERMFTCLRLFGGLATTCVLVGSAYWILKYLFKQKDLGEEFELVEDPIIPQTVVAGSKSTSHRVVKVRKVLKRNGARAANKVTMTNAKPQFLEESPLEALFTKVILPNQGTLTVKRGDRHATTYFLAVKDRMIFTVKHLLLSCKDDDGYVDGNADVILSLRRKEGEVYRFKLRDCLVTSAPTDDLLSLLLPKQVQPFRDIQHHFATDEEIALNDCSKTMMMEPRPQPVFYVSTNTIKGVEIAYRSDQGELIVNEHTLRYQIPTGTRRGMCFSIIASMNTQMRGQIIGAHVSGFNQQGNGTVLSKELIQQHEAMLYQTEPQAVLDWIVVKPEDASPMVPYGENTCYLGKVAPKLAHRWSSKSQIGPSLMHAVLTEPISHPSLLTKDPENETRWPLKHWAEKINKPQPKPLDHELMTEIKEAFIDATPAPIEVKVWNLEMAINGSKVRPLKFTPPMNMKTGKGFDPDNPEVRKKADYFEPHPTRRDCFVLKEKYEQEILKIIAVVYNKELKDDDLFMGELNWKDERLPLEKVEIGKTRGFVCMPTFYYLLFRMYFGAWMECYSLDRDNNGAAVGVNPHSLEWTGVVNRVKQQLGDDFKVQDGDASAWEWTVHPELQDMQLEEIEHFYKTHQRDLTDYEFEQEMRRVLFLNGTHHSFLLVARDVLQIDMGEFSGKPDTFLSNCFGNQRLQIYCFCKAAKRLREMIRNGDHKAAREYLSKGGELMSEEKFNWWRGMTKDFDIYPKNVREFIALLLGGDDFLNFLARCAQWYIFTIFVYEAKEAGFTFTNADKTDIVYTVRDLKDCRFLQRQFREEEGVYFAPLPMELIDEILNWQSVTMDPRVAIEQNVDCCLREMGHYGRVEFVKKKKIWNHTLVELGCKPNGLTYDQWLSEFMRGEMTVENQVEKWMLDEPMGEAQMDSGIVEMTKEEREAWEMVKHTGLDCQDWLKNFRVFMKDFESKGFPGPDFDKFMEGLVNDAYDYDFPFEVPDMPSDTNEEEKFEPQMRLFDEYDSEDDMYYHHVDWPNGDYDPFEEARLYYADLRECNAETEWLESEDEEEEDLEIIIEGVKYLFGGEAQGWTSLADSFYGAYNFKPSFTFSQSGGGWEASADFWGKKFTASAKTRKDAMQSVYEEVGNFFELWEPTEQKAGVLNFDETRLIQKVTKFVPQPSKAEVPTPAPKPKPVIVPVADFEKLGKADELPIQWYAYEQELLDLFAMAQRRFMIDRVGSQNIALKGVDDVLINLSKLDLCRSTLCHFYNVTRTILDGDEFKYKKLAYLELFKFVDSFKAHTAPAIAQSDEGIDRAPAQPISVEQVGLTTFQTLNEVPHQENRVAIPGYKDIFINPYPPLGVEKNIERIYNTANFNWNGSQTPGTLLHQSNYPYAIFNVAQNVVDKTNRAEYLHADVVIRIIITSTAFHSGTLLGGFLPHGPWNSATHSKFNNLYTLSTCNGFVLSASSNNSIEFTIPYMSPKPFIDLDKDKSNDGWIGSIALMVQTPLRQVGTTTTPIVSVAIYAGLKNVILAGPTLHAQSFSESCEEDLDVLYEKYLNERTVPQSEQSKKSSQGIMSSTLQAVGGVAAAVSKIPLLPSEVVLPVAAIGSAVQGAAKFVKQMGFDKPTSIATTTPIYRTTMNNLSNGKGLETIESLAFDPENAVANGADFFGRKADEMSNGHITRKPMFVDQFTFNGGNAVNSLLKIWRITPSWSPTYLQTDAVTYAIYPTPMYCALMDYAQWRGGMNVALQVIMPKVVNVEIRAAWHPSYSEVPTNYTDGAGDFYNKVFACNGDTWIKFSIPYLRRELYATVNPSYVKNDAGENGCIAISVVTSAVAATTSTGDSTVTVNCYIGACSDMRGNIVQVPFNNKRAKIIQAGIPLSSTPIAQGDSGSQFLDDIFSEDFPPLMDANLAVFHNICAGEETTHLSNLLHRYTGVNSVAVTEGFSTEFSVRDWADPQVNLGSVDYSVFAKWHSYFLYRKGSLNYKLLRAISTGVLPTGCLYASKVLATGITIINDPFNYALPANTGGFVMEEFGYKSVLEWKLPYECRWPFIGCTPCFGDEQEEVTNAIWYVSNQTSLTTIFASGFAAIGDDFRFGYLAGTPVLKILIPPSAADHPDNLAKVCIPTGIDPSEEKELAEVMEKFYEKAIVINKRRLGRKNVKPAGGDNNSGRGGNPPSHKE